MKINYSIFLISIVLIIVLVLSFTGIGFIIKGLILLLLVWYVRKYFRKLKNERKNND